MDGPIATSEATLLVELERFVYVESRLLDERKYAAWLECGLEAYKGLK